MDGMRKDTMLGPSGQDNDAADNNPRRRRAYHTRSKAGCITCRIRKVRCDEQKPSCKRCTSTGRKCDGYAEDTELDRPQQSNASLSKRPEQQASTSIPQQPRIPLPRNNAQELRSYHFFLDVTVPAITGVFDIDFWFTDIPRACHADPAIWHAVVSLGAVHESYIAGRGAAHESSGTEFAIQQFNAAIKHLIYLPSLRNARQEHWRALTACVLFAYLCSFQGLQSQSVLHVTAAKNLIKEFGAATANELGPAAAPTPSKAAVASALPNYTSPVSYESLLSVVANLDIHCQNLHGIGTNGPDVLDEVDAYTAWRYYSAPTSRGSDSVCQHGKCELSRATSENLARAGRAFESLHNALVTLSYQNSADVVRLVLGGEHGLLSTLINRQKPYLRAFCELDLALKIFIKDSTGDCSCFQDRPSPAEKQQAYPQRKSIDTLRIFHATCYPIFLEQPIPSFATSHGTLSSTTYHPLHVDGGVPSRGPADGIPGELARKANLIRHYTHALDIAESVFQNDYQQVRPAAAYFMPALPTTLPLVTMAQSGGLPLALRRRIIALLRRYPRCEGMWDSSFGAALAELILNHELDLDEKTTEMGQESSLKEQERRPGEVGGENFEEERNIPPGAQKVFGADVTFTGVRSAQVVIQTWAEWIGNEPGKKMSMQW